MGLMIGASWLTIIEFIQFVISLCIFCVTRSKRARVGAAQTPVQELTKAELAAVTDIG